MPWLARGEAIDPTKIQIVHCVERYVGHAFLGG